MKYKAIASNSKIYFGKDIPNMFMDSSGRLGKQFEGLTDKLGFSLEDEPLEVTTKDNWKKKKNVYNLWLWRLERALFFKMKQNAPPSHTTFLDSSSYCGKKGRSGHESTPLLGRESRWRIVFYFNSGK